MDFAFTTTGERVQLSSKPASTNRMISRIDQSLDLLDPMVQSAFQRYGRFIVDDRRPVVTTPAETSHPLNHAPLLAGSS